MAHQTPSLNFFYASSQRRKSPIFRGFRRFPLVGELSTEGLFGDFFASLQAFFSRPVVGRPLLALENQALTKAGFFDFLPPSGYQTA
jgi:hypothetical protein